MNYFPIKDLKRAEYNPRIMPAEEMESLMKSIETHGFVEPIVVNINPDRFGVIVGGHQRLTAVEKLMAKGIEIKGIKKIDFPYPMIPVFEIDLTLEAEKQLNIGLNKIHGKFDEDKIFDLIMEMKESPTLPTTGFREDEISRILDRDMEDTEEEDHNGTMPEARSVLGEVYDLGPHRLVCGIPTDQSDWQKLLGDQKADMIFTDPPYNVDYEGKTDEKMKIQNDKMTPELFRIFIDGAFKQMIDHVKVGAPLYICSGWSSYPQFLESMLKNGYYHSGVIIWVKNNATFGFNDYRYKHEWIAKAKKAEPTKAEAIIYGWKNGKHMFYGDNEFDVWEMPRRTANRNHPTEKPDWLPMRAIRNSTVRGDIVVDPFGGSGSVLAACEKTGRRAFMIELDPKFCDVIRNRWERILKAKEKENV